MLIEEVLQDAGLEPKEVQVYLSLLRHGPATQQDIANRTGLLRQTVYELVKKMAFNGYVARQVAGKKQAYAAIRPRLLLDKLHEKEARLLQAIPQLERMELRESVQVHSESFVGIEGVKNAINLTLGSSEELLWFDNISLSEKMLGGEYYWMNYAQKRAQSGIPIKLLISPEDKSYLDSDKSMLRQTRRSPIVSDVRGSFVIFEDKVIIYSVEEGQVLGVLIQNRAIKHSFEKIFFDLWRGAQGGTLPKNR